MEKTKFLKRKVLLLLVGFLTLWSCQQDDFYHKNADVKKEMNFQKVSFENIIKDAKHKKVKESFIKFKEETSLKNNPNIQGKLVYNEEYGFYIDDENGIFIEKEDYQSYTFRIERPESDGKLENVVFSSKSDGEFDIKIVTYDITYEEIEVLGKEEITNRNVEYSSYNNYQTEMLPDLICYDVWTLKDANYDCTCPESGEMIWVLELQCHWTTGGGGGSGGGSGSGSGNGSGGSPGSGGPGFGGGGGSGSGSGNGNPPAQISDTDGNIITTPITPLYPKRNHLQELNNITNNNPTIRTYINNFRESLSDPLIEEGIEFNNNSSPFPPQYATYNGVKFFPVSVNDPKTRVHKHHDELDPIFSFEDIFGMAEFFHQKARHIDPMEANNITSIMVSRTGVHALRVRDPQKVQDFYNYLISGNLGGARHFKSAYTEDVIIETIDYCNGVCTPAQLDDVLIQNFIIFLNKLDSGLDYYFAPHPANSNDNHVWIKRN